MRASAATFASSALLLASTANAQAKLTTLAEPSQTKGQTLPSLNALPSQILNLNPAPKPSTNSTNRQDRANAVKEAFTFAWKGYYQYAFPNDELTPVDNGFSNSRNGWGASAVDALSTAIVMEIPEIVDQIVNYIPTINYGVSKDNEPVSLFETTIRYLAGMLSGYDFLTGPLPNLASNKTAVEELLTQSKNLANYLSYAFDTPSGVPENNLIFGGRTNDGSKTANLAQVGTLVLEWTRLADLTGNNTYADLAAKGESYLLNPQPALGQPFPGLVGSNIAIADGQFQDGSGGWVGGDDSFYEYLIKMYVYDSSRFASYKDRWTEAADSTIKYLTSHPSTRPDLTYVTEFDGTRTINESQHLACFDGGNFILGGTVLKRPDYIDYGLKLTEACHNTYISTATRIGPEVFAWDPNGVPVNQADFYKKNGFYITNSIYDLRPEVVESYYYAYQFTGNPKYQDWAWDAFLAINKTCRVGSGFSQINDVNAPDGGGAANNQESFLFAELMKYLFLIQAPQREWDVQGTGLNQWVFNTEAHPLKVKRVTGL